MQLTSLWLLDITGIVIICQVNMEVIYYFVCVLIAFLIGCMLTGTIIVYQYRSHLEEAPILMTQKVKVVRRSDLVQITQAVTMDTARYLEAVRLNHE